MQKLFPKITMVASCVALAACGSADDENSMSGAFNKGFEESWSTEFVKGCVSEAVKVGAAEAEATEACSCVGEKLLPTLDGFTEKMNPPQEKMEQALKACGIPAG